MTKKESIWSELKEIIIKNRANYVIWTLFYFIAAAVWEWALIFMWRPGIMNVGHPIYRMLMFYGFIVGIYLIVTSLKLVAGRRERYR